MSKKENTILVISDLHAPFQHPDALAFLTAIKTQMYPSKVICIGDEVDHHSLSFHDSDPDLLSAGDELQAAIKVLKKLYKLFPEAQVVESNHGSMVYRKGKHHGIPRKYIKDYADVLEAPTGWSWHDEVILDTKLGEVMFRHQFKKDPLIAAQQMAMSVVQGHFHEDCNIQYVSSPNKLLWAMTVGCLIDKKSLAFTYNKTNTKRPIIGVGMIINGLPQLIPMVLDKSGRWIGKLL